MIRVLQRIIDFIVGLFKSTPAIVDSEGAQWCVVANIVNYRWAGVGGNEKRRGTKHFKPGTKVYCFPSQWGDGYSKIVVIGRHRYSRKMVQMVIRANWVTNARAKVVYHPEVLRLLQHNRRRNWESKEQVETHLYALQGIDGARRKREAKRCQESID